MAREVVQVRLPIPLLAFVSVLVPASIDASCTGLHSLAEIAACREAEDRMNQRAREQMKAAQERVLYVEIGKGRVTTNEFELLFEHSTECQWLRRVDLIRDSSFRVVDQDGKTFTEGACRCCTHFERDPASDEFVPRRRGWELHGKHILFNAIRNDPDLPPVIENDYWCGVEIQRLSGRHHESLAEGCEVPIVPWPEPVE